MILLGACSAPGPEDLLADAKRLLETQDRKAAVLQLKTLLQEFPDHAEARYLLGKSSHDAWDFRSAEKELRRASELHYDPNRVAPLFAHALVGLGQPDKALHDIDPESLTDPAAKALTGAYRSRALLALGKIDDAKATLGEALRIDENLGPALVTQAHILVRQNDLAGANEMLGRVLAANGKDVEALMLRAAIDRSGGRDAEARAGLEKAVAVAPAVPGPRVALASLLIDAGRYDDARLQARELRAIPEGGFEATMIEGQIALRERKFEAARDAAAQALNMAPDHSRALYVAAVSELALGSLAPAETALRKIVARAPGFVPARRLLAETLLRQGSADAAEAVLEPIVQAASVDSDTLALAGQVALQAGDSDKAQRLLKRAAEARPGDARLQSALAASQVLGNEAAAGIETLEKLSAKERGQYQSDVMLIMTHVRSSTWDKALQAVSALENKQPGNPLTFNLRGIVLGGKQDYKAARQAFEKAVALQPEYAPAVINLAQLDLREGREADARRRLEALLARQGSNPRALVALAELKSRSGAPHEEVGKLLARAVSDNPNLLTPRAALVRWYVGGGEPDKAIELAKETQEKFPRSAEALSLLGTVQLAAGESSQALTTFRTLANEHPRVPASYFQLAHAQVLANDLDGARKSLGRTIELDPNHPGARLALIEVEARSANGAKALELAREFEQSHPRVADAYLLEGDLLMSGGDHPAATAAYRKALMLLKTGPVAIKVHQSLLSGGQHAEADRFGGAWLKDNPRDGAFRGYLAQLLLAAGDFEGARKAYLALLELQPRSATVLNNLAWACLKSKNVCALEYGEKAYQLAPRDPRVLDTLGVIRLDRGDLEKSVSLLAEASMLAPNAPGIRFHHGVALAKTGRKEEARQELTEALESREPFDEKVEAKKLLDSL